MQQVLIAFVPPWIWILFESGLLYAVQKNIKAWVSIMANSPIHCKPVYSNGFTNHKDHFLGPETLILMSQVPGGIA